MKENFPEKKWFIKTCPGRDTGQGSREEIWPITTTMTRWAWENDTQASSGTEGRKDFSQNCAKSCTEFYSVSSILYHGHLCFQLRQSHMDTVLQTRTRIDSHPGPKSQKARPCSLSPLAFLHYSPHCPWLALLMHGVRFKPPLKPLSEKKSLMSQNECLKWKWCHCLWASLFKYPRDSFDSLFEEKAKSWESKLNAQN